MGRLKPASVRALLFAAAPALVAAGMIGSPEGRIAAAAAGAICALPALLAGTRTMRIGATVLLLCAGALAWGAVDPAKESFDAYRNRGHREPAPPAVPSGISR